MTEKEMLVVVFAFNKFRSYLIGSKVIVYIDHAALRYLAFESTRLYTKRMKRLHDKNIMERNFNPGDIVLLSNSRLRLFPRKLKSRWSGPFRVVEVFPSGAVEIVAEKESHTFRVNGQRLKLYAGKNEPKEVTEIHLTEPQRSSKP
ncbi:uncharacterized protein [Nicotiana sylvestris]|uniref:uncharacterized protein n=1 Tax=Nicotiana sylvestris TaxID=4096 RepID=UPI00388C5315